jgi:hypothetical protein
MNHTTLKSIGAILAGLFTVVLLSIATDMLLHAAGIFPALGQPMSDKLFLLATLYRTLYGVLGGYIAARLAPNRPIGHALLLGYIGLAASIAGAIATWGRGAAYGHEWYPLALVVLAVPGAWLGGRLRKMQLKTHHPA